MLDDLPRSNIVSKKQYSEEKDRIICEKYLAGATREDIMIQTGFPLSYISTVIARRGLKKVIEERNEQICKKILVEKVPILTDIASMSLTHIKEWLLELDDPEVRQQRLKTVQDVRSLSAMTKELNEMLRLELGQSTLNVKHDVQLSLDQTKKIFSDLRQVDQVFDYPLEEDGEVID